MRKAGLIVAFTVRKRLSLPNQSRLTDSTCGPGTKASVRSYRRLLTKKTMLKQGLCLWVAEFIDSRTRTLSFGISLCGSQPQAGHTHHLPTS